MNRIIGKRIMVLGSPEKEREYAETVASLNGRMLPLEEDISAAELLVVIEGECDDLKNHPLLENARNQNKPILHVPRSGSFNKSLILGVITE
ncbi:MAG: hypothetical protein AB1500_03040 [Bacillota bacterium]